MRRNSNGISARVLVMAVALTLIIGGIIGGSVAWLTAKTDAVVNTFTVGDISINLSETTGTSYKFVPGNDITKDPKVVGGIAVLEDKSWYDKDCGLVIKETGEGIFG